MTISTAAHIVLSIVFALLTLRMIGWAAIERRHEILAVPLIIFGLLAVERIIQTPISDVVGVAILVICGSALTTGVVFFSLRALLVRKYSPEAIEERQVRRTESLTRLSKALADNPHYSELLKLREEISSVGGEEACELLEEVDRLMGKARHDARAEALEPRRRELRQIAFEIDPEHEEIPDDRVVGD
jgi:hypothetical protein